MSASNDSGNMQFWFQGFPITGLKNGTLDAGGMQFWFEGFPMMTLFPAATTNTKGNFFLLF